MGRTSDHRRADSNHQEPTLVGGLCKTWCKQTGFFWWVGNKRKISWNRNLKCWQRRWGGVDVEKSKHYLDLYLGVQWREDFPGKRLSCKVKDLYTDFRRSTKLSWNSPKSTVLSEWSTFQQQKDPLRKHRIYIFYCQGGRKTICIATFKWNWLPLMNLDFDPSDLLWDNFELDPLWFCRAISYFSFLQINVQAVQI